MPARTSASAWHLLPAGLAALRSLAAAIVLVALYFLLPLDHLAAVPLPVILVVGLLVLLVVTGWQLRLVVRARYPAIRAGEAWATTVPLFLLLFASVYFAMARGSPASFSTHSLTRTDSLYFTVTTFSTVGYGDITATSQAARLMVTVQIILDLLVLGLGIRIFIGAVQRARQEHRDPAGPAAAPEQPRQQPG
jgi:voltage-gated potassium channel